MEDDLNFFYIEEPLTYYRIHVENYSKKLKIYTAELKKWLDTNSLKMSKLNLSLSKLLRLKELLFLQNVLS